MIIHETGIVMLSIVCYHIYTGLIPTFTSISGQYD